MCGRDWDLTRRGGDLGLPNGAGLAVFQFLTELTRLFQKCRLSGSVFITLKKCKRLSTRPGWATLEAERCPGRHGRSLPRLPYLPAPCPGHIRGRGTRRILGIVAGAASSP